MKLLHIRLSFQVTCQLRILTTALFSVIILRKYLAPLQWMALFMLFWGVCVVQMEIHTSSAKELKEKGQHHGNPFEGLMAVLTVCVMSGFACVYFEKMLKGARQSVWLRNVQLSMVGVGVGSLTSVIKEGDTIIEDGFFSGYDWQVWAVVILQALGGLLIAIVMKHADNILKGFATSASMMLSTVLSIYFFGYSVSIPFFLGAGMVVSAILMYSKFEGDVAPKYKNPELTVVQTEK